MNYLGCTVIGSILISIAHFTKVKTVFAIATALVFSSCGFNETADDQPYPFPSSDILSNEIWIADAEDWLNLNVEERTFYTLYASISKDDKDIEMHFDENRRLFIIDILSNDGLKNRLFCEQGKIVFSNHYNPNGGKETLLAYANGKVYAAAQKTDGNWLAVLPQNMVKEINTPIIQTALQKGLLFQQKEIQRSSAHRILTTETLISEEDHGKIHRPFFLNVRKDDRIHIEISDQKHPVYFTVNQDPDNYATEFTTWDGTAEKTGDLELRFFKIAPNPRQDFVLKTKITPHSPDYARAH